MNQPPTTPGSAQPAMTKQELTCGCVIGYYWCSAHDIYTRQDRQNDPRWTKPETMICERSGPNECCSCHISAPCSFCTRDVEEAATKRTKPECYTESEWQEILASEAHQYSLGDQPRGENTKSP